MALTRSAAFAFLAGLFLAPSNPSIAAPFPHATPDLAPPSLVEPVCHRGVRHRSGRPCYYRGPGYGPPVYRPGPGYGYRPSQRVCSWRYNQWGQAVRVCRWR